MADISHNVETCPGKSQYEEEAERQVVKNTLADIAVTRNGVTLHPQPTSDPLDPLNWSNLRKHSILAIVMWKYFLFAYLTTTTIPSFTQIEKRLGINYAQTSWTISLPSLGLAIGPPLWSSLADIYGRRIVFIAGSVIALVSTIGIAVTTNFKGYMAGRFFQGVGVSPSAAIGMAIVGDLFFEYERGQKLGLWVMAMDCGFLLGPLIGGFMNLVSLDWVIWLNVILFGVLLVLVVFFLPETLYPRTTMLHQMPAIQSGAKEGSDLELAAVKVRSADQSDLPRTTKLPFINFKPVPGMRHPKPWDSILLTWSTFRIFAVTIPLWVFALTIYWWNPAAMTMIPAAYAQFPPQIQGLLFVGMLLGIVFAEIFCSGNLSDYICAKLTIKNDHIRIAEMRLWLIYPACVLISVGLVLWGISIDQNYHWMFPLDFRRATPYWQLTWSTRILYSRSALLPITQ
ncbi:unnamed protein product [Penicillium bialowiezense]